MSKERTDIMLKILEYLSDVSDGIGQTHADIIKNVAGDDNELELLIHFLSDMGLIYMYNNNNNQHVYRIMLSGYLVLQDKRSFRDFGWEF